MLLLVKFIGILVIGIGIIILLSPDSAKRIIAFWQKGKRIYIAGIIRLLLGIVFLLTASQCRLVGAIITLGILSLLGGVLVFILGLERVKSIINWWAKQSLLFIRFWGLFAIALGALIIYSV